MLSTIFIGACILICVTAYKWGWRGAVWRFNRLILWLWWCHHMWASLHSCLLHFHCSSLCLDWENSRRLLKSFSHCTHMGNQEKGSRLLASYWFSFGHYSHLRNLSLCVSPSLYKYTIPIKIKIKLIKLKIFSSHNLRKNDKIYTAENSYINAIK